MSITEFIRRRCSINDKISSQPCMIPLAGMARLLIFDRAVI
jgi:hypothetical protein